MTVGYWLLLSDIPVDSLPDFRNNHKYLLEFVFANSLILLSNAKWKSFASLN
eukprot:IDg2016t1